MAKTICSDLYELQAEIERRFDIAIQNEVADSAKKIFIKHAKKTGKASGRAGGLGDPLMLGESYNSKLGRLLIFSKARPRPSLFGQPIRSNATTLFTEWVNSGSLFDLSAWGKAGHPIKGSYPNGAFRHPRRPFIDSAQAELNSQTDVFIKKIGKYF